MNESASHKRMSARGRCIANMLHDACFLLGEIGTFNNACKTVYEDNAGGTLRNAEKRGTTGRRRDVQTCENSL